MTVYLVTVLFVLATSYLADCQKIYHTDTVQPYSNKKQYQKFVVLTSVALILVSGLRYYVGADYGSYLNKYLLSNETLTEIITVSDDKGFSFIAWISRLIYDDYATMFFISALITVGLSVKTLAKYSDSFCMSILLYIFIGSWTGAFNGLRQYLAAAVLFAGHRFITDKKFVKYCIVVLIASMFHVTALIMFPVYFIADKKISWKTILIYITAAVVLRFSYDRFFAIMSSVKGTEQSVHDYMQRGVNILRILVNIIPIVFIPMLTDTYRDSKDNRIYFNMLILNAVFIVGMGNSSYLARIGIYTEIYTALAIPRFIKAFKGKDKTFLIVSVMLLYFLYFFYLVFFDEGTKNFMWIWQR